MKVKLTESAVGKPGRTGKEEAEVFVRNNPQIIKEFQKIVKKMGGKQVAATILNMKLFGKPSEQPKIKYKMYKQIQGES